MRPELVAYLKRQSPQLDAVGRWAFIANARTGSTSITGGALRTSVIMQHRDATVWNTVWEKSYANRIDEPLIFTVVRNPWDRVVSAWMLLQEKGRIGLDSFTEFINRGNLDNPELEHFFVPQAASFMFGGSWINEVFVARYESLANDWKKIADRIGVSDTLPHRNGTDHKPYHDYYDVEAIKRVASFYATEIDALGYTFA